MSRTQVILIGMLVVLIYVAVAIIGAKASAFTPSGSKPPSEVPRGTPTPPSTPKPDVDASVQKIVQLAGQSTCSKYRWKDRGLAPAGYIKGSALTYARAYCERDSSFQKVVSGPVGGEKDLLNRYASTLKSDNIPITSSDQRLRVIYTAMIGLGMRESSGRYCTGRDASMDFTAADTAESGLHQTSWNARAFNSKLGELFYVYAEGQRKCQLETYKEGVAQSYCEKPSQVKLWGDPSSSGYAFQKLHKKCPALSTEFAAGVVRFSGGAKSHYGPIRTKALEIRKECFDLLGQVEKLVNSNPEICKAL